MKNLFEVFTRLNADPFTQVVLASDPARAGLTPEECDAMVRWKQGAREPLLGGDNWTRCAVCGDPGDDPLPDSEMPTR